MIRIYLTDTDIEGYNEGCSCCSSTESVGEKEIKELIGKLENQRKDLSLLLALVQEHGREKVIYWYGLHQRLIDLKRAVEAGLNYEKDKPAGTYWKECFDNLAENTAALTRVTKEFKKLPSTFKKYVLN